MLLRSLRIPALLLILGALIAGLQTWDLPIGIFQWRDIQRALELSRGHWIFHGPELSGGGFLPGPLYYWLLLPPTWFVGTLDTTNLFRIWQILLFGLSGVLVWWETRRIWGPVPALWAWLCWNSTRFILVGIRDFRNPSFLPLVAVAAILLWIRARESQSDRTAMKLWVAAAFVAGCSIQFHFSGVGLIIAPWILLLLNRRWKLAALWLVSSLLPSVPYLIWSLTQANTSEGAGLTAAISGRLEGWTAGFMATSWESIFRSLSEGHGFLLMSTVLALAGRFPRTTSELTLLAGVTGLYSMPQFLSDPWRTRYFFLFFMVWTWWAGVNGAIRLNQWLYGLPLRKALVVNGVISAALVASFFEFSIAPDRSWLWAAGFLGVLAVIFWIEFGTRLKSLQGVLLLLPLLTAGVLFSLATQLSGIRTVEVDYAFLPEGTEGQSPWVPDPTRHAPILRRMVPLEVLKRFLNTIESKTGWNAEEAQERILVVAMSKTLELRSAYPAPSRSTLQMPEAPTGYILTAPGFEDRFQHGLPTDMSEGLKQGSIQLDPPLFDQGWGLIAYRIKRGTDLPLHFHTQGAPFPTQEEAILEKHASGDSTSTQLAPNEVVLIRKPCSPAQVCASALRLDWKKTGGEHEIHASLIGRPLSLIAVLLNPPHVEVILNSTLSVSCGRKVHQFALGRTIGSRVLDRLQRQTYGIPAPAPLRYSFTLKGCTNAPDEFTWKAASVLTSKDLGPIRELPGFSINWKSSLKPK